MAGLASHTGGEDSMRQQALPCTSISDSDDGLTRLRLMLAATCPLVTRSETCRVCSGSQEVPPARYALRQLDAVSGD
jgi:hypothetical protein